MARLSLQDAGGSEDQQTVDLQTVLLDSAPGDEVAKKACGSALPPQPSLSRNSTSAASLRDPEGGEDLERGEKSDDGEEESAGRMEVAKKSCGSALPPRPSISRMSTTAASLRDPEGGEDLERIEESSSDEEEDAAGRMESAKVPKVPAWAQAKKRPARHRAKPKKRPRPKPVEQEAPTNWARWAFVLLVVAALLIVLAVWIYRPGWLGLGPRQAVIVLALPATAADDFQVGKKKLDRLTQSIWFHEKHIPDRALSWSAVIAAMSREDTPRLRKLLVQHLLPRGSADVECAPFTMETASTDLFECVIRRSDNGARINNDSVHVAEKAVLDKIDKATALVIADSKSTTKQEQADGGEKLLLTLMSGICRDVFATASQDLAGCSPASAGASSPWFQEKGSNAPVWFSMSLAAGQFSLRVSSGRSTGIHPEFGVYPPFSVEIMDSPRRAWSTRIVHFWQASKQLAFVDVIRLLAIPDPDKPAAWTASTKEKQEGRALRQMLSRVLGHQIFEDVDRDRLSWHLNHPSIGEFEPFELEVIDKGAVPPTAIAKDGPAGASPLNEEQEAEDSADKDDHVVGFDGFDGKGQTRGGGQESGKVHLKGGGDVAESGTKVADDDSADDQDYRCKGGPGCGTKVADDDSADDQGLADSDDEARIHGSGGHQAESYTNQAESYIIAATAGAAKELAFSKADGGKMIMQVLKMADEVDAAFQGTLAKFLSYDSISDAHRSKFWTTTAQLLCLAALDSDGAKICKQSMESRNLQRTVEDFEVTLRAWEDKCQSAGRKLQVGSDPRTPSVYFSVGTTT